MDHVLDELIEQPHNLFHFLSSIVAATDTSMRFSADLPMGGSAITDDSQPIPCCDSNCDNITNITNITTVANMGLLDR